MCWRELGDIQAIEAKGDNTKLALSKEKAHQEAERRRIRTWHCCSV